MNLTELTEALSRCEEIFGSRFEHLLWQIEWYAEHTQQRFDVTFYDREPLLEVTLAKDFAKDFAREWRPWQRKALINRIAFSDGTIVSATEIWTLNYMRSTQKQTTKDCAPNAALHGPGAAAIFAASALPGTMKAAFGEIISRCAIPTAKISSARTSTAG
jgi:hypothetical protein